MSHKVLLACLPSAIWTSSCCKGAPDQSNPRMTVDSCCKLYPKVVCLVLLQEHQNHSNNVYRWVYV